jgi:hypothetical protein
MATGNISNILSWLPIKPYITQEFVKGTSEEIRLSECALSLKHFGTDLWPDSKMRITGDVREYAVSYLNQRVILTTSQTDSATSV